MALAVRASLARMRCSTGVFDLCKFHSHTAYILTFEFAVPLRRVSTWIKPAISIEVPGAKQAVAAEGLYVHAIQSNLQNSLLPLHPSCRVNITFVNYAGERTTLPGRVGETLYEVARRYKYEYLDGPL